MRTFKIIVALATVVLAFALYWEKYDTRRIETNVQAMERRIEREQAAIAILKAEIAYLSRPERLESLARDTLGLVPREVSTAISPEALAALPDLAEANGRQHETHAGDSTAGRNDDAPHTSGDIRADGWNRQ